MPNGLTNLTGGLVEQAGNTIENIARAATTRHRHSTHFTSSTVIPVPPPPQHTNISSVHHNSSMGGTVTNNTTTANRLSADYSSSAPSSVTIYVDHNGIRRNSQVGLISSVDGPTSNMSIEFDGGTHVIVRPNRIVRGKYMCVYV
jgi:hypothetical protein